MESELRKILIDSDNHRIQLHGSKNMRKTIEGTEEEFDNMMKFIEGCKKAGLLNDCYIKYCTI